MSEWKPTPEMVRLAKRMNSCAEDPGSPFRYPTLATFRDVVCARAAVFAEEWSRCLKEACSFPENKFLNEALQEIVNGLNPTYRKKDIEYHPGLLVADSGFIRSMKVPVDMLIGKLDRHYRRGL